MNVGSSLGGRRADRVLVDLEDPRAHRTCFTVDASYGNGPTGTLTDCSHIGPVRVLT